MFLSVAECSAAWNVAPAVKRQSSLRSWSCELANSSSTYGVFLAPLVLYHLPKAIILACATARYCVDCITKWAPICIRRNRHPCQFFHPDRIIPQISHQPSSFTCIDQLQRPNSSSNNLVLYPYSQLLHRKVLVRHLRKCSISMVLHPSRLFR